MTRKSNAYIAKIFCFCMYTCKTDERNGTKRSEQCERTSERGSDSTNTPLCMCVYYTNGFCYLTHIRLFTILLIIAHSSGNVLLQCATQTEIYKSSCSLARSPTYLFGRSPACYLSFSLSLYVYRHNKFHWTDWEWTMNKQWIHRKIYKDNSIQYNHK